MDEGSNRVEGIEGGIKTIGGSSHACLVSGSAIQSDFQEVCDITTTIASTQGSPGLIAATTKKDIHEQVDVPSC